MKYKLSSGTKIKRMFKVGKNAWSWEEIVTTKDAYFIDQDLVCHFRMSVGSLIEIKIPSDNYPYIHVSEPDLEPVQ